MQITTPTPRTHARDGVKESKRGKKSSVNDLKRSDLIADIFNNDDEKQKKRRDARVFLSRTSSALTAELRTTIYAFLKKNNDISRALEEISLPEEYEESIPPNTDLRLRKMSMYKQWMIHYSGQLITPLDKNELDEAEAPYHEIHKQGKDGEIEQIYLEHESKKEELLRSRKRNVPNYYYLVFPETYSFN